MIRSLTSILLFSTGIVLTVSAQDDCSFPLELGLFQANYIRTYFNPPGDKFWDRQDAGFFVPDKGKQTPSTIFSGNLWLGAHDQDGALHVSANTFYNPARTDFVPGPLVQLEDGGAGVFDEVYCGLFDRVWTVNRKEILEHIKDFTEDGDIDFFRPAVFGWPAEGNASFEEFNGFALPLHQGGWADFADLNENGLYEPGLGEYPHVVLEGNARIPDQVLWLVFNDLGGDHNSSNGNPLGIEVQLTAFAFFCGENELMNHTLFNSYKVINQGENTYRDFYLGHWMDPDLGCFSDDYFGNDPARNTVYVYNQDAVDGQSGELCPFEIMTYGQNPPVQAVTFLNHPLAASVYYLNGALFNNPAMVDPETPEEYYNYLKGRWRDGTPFTNGGTGYDPLSTDTTSFSFPDSPDDPAGWSMYTADIPDADWRVISSVQIDSLLPGKQERFDIAYSFHQDQDSNHVQTVNLMAVQVDQMLSDIGAGDLLCSQVSQFCQDNCVWPGDLNADGIVDQFDVLNLGVAFDASGSMRNGLTNWQGHFADSFISTFPDGVNYKHADANGDGIVDVDDKVLVERHFLYRHDGYVPSSVFPEGDEIRIELQNQGAMLGSHTSFFIDIRANMALQGIYGLAFTLHFDTALFMPVQLSGQNPFEQDNILELQGNGREGRYAVVLDNHEAGQVLSEARIANGFLRVRPGLETADLPDSTFVRLGNLTAIDEAGNQIEIGCDGLGLYKEMATSASIGAGRDEGLLVFPNPTSGILHIRPAKAGKFFITVLDLKGQKLMEVAYAEGAQTAIDLSNLSSGVYVLRVRTSYGVSTQRILLAK